MKRLLFKLVIVLLVAITSHAGAETITVSMGQAWGVNGDSVALNAGGDPADTTKTLINAFNDASIGNTNAFEIVVDMGEVKDVAAILTQNRPVAYYGVPWDVRVYVATDEGAAGFDPLLASSFTQELTPGTRTMLTPASTDANVWKSWTLPTPTQRRYVKIDITGLGFGGVNSTRTLAQWQDIDMTEQAVVPITASIGSVWAVNGDDVTSGTYLGLPLINAYNNAVAGNTDAIELVADMGEVKNVESILMQNLPALSYGVPWDLRIYIAPDESAPGFDPLLASSFSQELTSGRTMLSPASADPNVIKSLVLPNMIIRRYVKIDITGIGQGGINASRTLSQMQDIDMAPPVPYASIGLLWGVNGDTVNKYGEDPSAAGHIIINGINSTGTGDVDVLEFVADMQSVTDIASFGIQNRAVLSYLNPCTTRIYVAPDENAAGFNPQDANSFTQQINVFTPYDMEFFPSVSDANVLKYVNVTPVSRRFVKFEITEIDNGPISTSSALAQWQDVLVSATQQGLPSAGSIIGLGEDEVHFGQNGGYDYMSFFDYDGINEGLTADSVIDLSVVKDIQKIRSINCKAGDTLFNIKNVKIYVTPASGSGSENEVGFDPLDKANYTVEIFNGSFYPSSYLAGVERIADVTDVSRRYIMLEISSNYWDDFGEMIAGGTVYNYYARNADFEVVGTDSINRCKDVIDLGLTLQTDICPDCYINALDLEAMAEQWTDCTDPDGSDCVEQENHPTYYIAKAPTSGITVDGDISDWPADSEWIWLDKVYYREYPSDVDYAEFSMRWDDATDQIFVAVVVSDSNQVFVDVPDYTYSDSDRVEIYSQGDADGGTGWGAGGTAYFDVAQHYIVGPKSTGHWALWGDLTAVDTSALQSAVAVDGDEIVYEFAVKQYNNYGGISGVTEVTQLVVGQIIGFDVALGSRYADDTLFGMLSENVFAGKSQDAGQFQQYELADSLTAKSCGDWGYLAADIVPDCIVNLEDFAAFAEKWMQCNDPADEVNCVHNW